MTKNDKRKESVAFMNPGATSTPQLLPQPPTVDESSSCYLNDGFSLQPWGTLSPALKATPDNAMDKSLLSSLPPYLPTQDICDGSYHEAITISAESIGGGLFQEASYPFPASTSSALSDPMPYADSLFAHLDASSCVSDYATTPCRWTKMTWEKTSILERELTFRASAAHYAPYSAKRNGSWPLVFYDDVGSQCAPPSTVHDDADNALTASQSSRAAGSLTTLAPQTSSPHGVPAITLF
ncbi:hypothetical protein S40293_11533 [Stachybotrys chartarum IBT 40293]|nr:hypothetical protein S40293_11533 [Stachybotrys chartarum IBT 40293]